LPPLEVQPGFRGRGRFRPSAGQLAHPPAYAGHGRRPGRRWGRPGRRLSADRCARWKIPTVQRHGSPARGPPCDRPSRLELGW